MAAESTKTPVWVSIPVLSTTRDKVDELKMDYAKRHGKTISTDALVAFALNSIQVLDLPAPAALPR